MEGALRTTPQKERRWFEETVVKRATRQIRDTLSYLKTYPVVEVSNEWGHAFNVAAAKIATLHKICIPLPCAPVRVMCFHEIPQEFDGRRDTHNSFF